MNDIEKELKDIRNLMERSSRFLTLSGLHGVLAGIYALVGTGIAYYLLYYPLPPFGYSIQYNDPKEAIPPLMLVALVVLVAALLTGFFLTKRNSQNKGQVFWATPTKKLALNLALPLATGGIFILILISQGNFAIVAATSLIFYGLALINGSYYTLSEVRYLGICEIILGLICAVFPSFGLLFWAGGFGVLHIVYGSIMYIKYER